MPCKMSTPFLALAFLLVFASVAQPPSDKPATPRPRGPLVLPDAVRLQREELLSLRRELVGRRILRTVREQLPHAKLPEVMRQFNIRPDERLRGLSDEEIQRMVDETAERIRRYVTYDSPGVGVETKDLCEDVAGLDADVAPVLSCVEDEAIVTASRSVAAIVADAFIAWDERASGWVLKTRLLERADTGTVDLCQSEPIRNSPSTLVAGTAFLIAQDVVATAGHVVYDENVLQSHYFVFGYVMKRDGEPKTVFSKDDVYKGTEIVARQTGDADFALVRLDRPVTGRGPLEYRKSGQIPDTAKLYMLGHPEGMPMKYVGEAPISWNRPCTYFLAPLDPRPGNSGSPVFDASTHQVEGIMVRDAPTYVTVCECVITGIHSEAYGYMGADVIRTTRFAGLLAHPASVLVRSMLPQDSYALIEVGGVQYTFDTEGSREQLLPYDLLGFYLLEDADKDCWLRYQPEGGSVWDIQQHATSGHALMVEACFR